MRIHPNERSYLEILAVKGKTKLIKSLSQELGGLEGKASQKGKSKRQVKLVTV